MSDRTPRHIIAVTGLVRDNDGRVLLVRNARGWEMPGGQVEQGEELVAALAREIREEAGCEISVGRLYAIHSNLTKHLLVLAFHATWTSGDIRGGAECSDAGWFDPEAALGAVTAMPALDRLRDGLAAHRHLVLRSYTKQRDGNYHVVSEGQA